MTSPPNVVYQFSYHIIPFVFEKQYSYAKEYVENRKIHLKNGKEVFCWKAMDFGGGQRLITNVNCIISKNDLPGTIGRRYILEDFARNQFHLPGNPSNPLSCEFKDGQACEFFIQSVDLYIFETQVGFLAFEIGFDIKSNSIDDIIDSNYYLKNTVQNRDKIFYNKRIEKNQYNKIPIKMDEIIAKALEGLAVSTYFEGKNELPKQAIVYNAICLNDSRIDDKLIHTYLFRMRRLFKDTYKPSSAEFDFHNNPEILQLFDNNYWGVSLEGIANLIQLVEDEETNIFVTGGYKGHVESTYLFLYILALHQRYALLHYSIVLSDVEKVNEDNNLQRTISIERMKKIKLDVAFFNVRSIFTDVSGITHQARLYDTLIKALRIREMNNEIKSELDGLSTILEIEEEKKKAICEKEISRAQKQKEQKSAKNSEKLHFFIAATTTIFVIIQTFNSAWDIFNKITTNNNLHFGSIGFVIFLVSSGILMLSVIVVIFWYLRRITSQTH